MRARQARPGPVAGPAPERRPRAGRTLAGQDLPDSGSTGEPARRSLLAVLALAAAEDAAWRLVDRHEPP
ncbi:MAG: hypothetical protein M9894_23915 [Planctomycetes bacterium]|nr:hypothetical protein [Planctomycetota bacterium]